MFDRMTVVAAALALLLIGAARPGEAAWRFQTKDSTDLSWTTLMHDGVNRGFGWYMGTSPGPAPAPVVVILHGGGGNADGVWSGDDGRAWRRLADEHGLVLLLPEGRPDLDNPDAHHWNDCRSDVLEPNAASTADDVGFLRAVVAWSKARWPVNPERVYVTGASNGGMMSYRLAMEAPGLLAAAGAVIANLPDPSECPGSFAPLSILIMNGTADPLMPWDGGCVGISGCDRGTVASTLETVSFWVDIDDTGHEPVCISFPDTVPEDGSTVTSCTWSDGIGGSEIVLFRINGGGHAPPGPDPLPFWYRLIVGPKNHDISAPDEIWAFFERHRRLPPRPRQPAGRAP